MLRHKIKAQKVGLISAFLLSALAPQSYGQEGTATLSLPAQANFARQVTRVGEIKKSLSYAQKKLSSQLVRALPSKRVTFGRILPFAKTNVLPDAELLVDIHTKVTPQVLRTISAVGGRVISSFPEDDAVRAKMTPAAAEQVAALSDVKFIEPAEEPVTLVTSQGDIAHKADSARQNFKVRGAGVKIGVLSDSVDGLAQSQQKGELGNVTVLSGQSGSPATGEGTAMLEIIHDLAPDAQLYFATGFGGQANMANNIRQLAKLGCKIIVDDVGYFEEPVFQEDTVSAAIREVSQKNGVLYFTSAGNFGSKTAGKSSYWEGNFVDGGKTSIYDLGNDDTHIHKFGSSTFNQVLAVGEGNSNKSCFLQWSSPYNAAKDDYDLWLVDNQGFVVDLSADTQDGSTPPAERIFTPAASKYQIIVTKYSGKSRYLSLLLGSGSLGQFTSGSCRGHNAAEFAISVAAAPAPRYPLMSPKPGQPLPFDATSVTESFSSDGPRRMFYNSDGTAHNVILQKPNMTAADAVTTSVPGFSDFHGTSAAAPHAAAIAALAWSANPSLTASGIRAVLVSSAIDIMKPKTDYDSGVGIVMAFDAVRSAIALKSVKSASGGTG